MVTKEEWKRYFMQVSVMFKILSVLLSMNCNSVYIIALYYWESMRNSMQSSDGRFDFIKWIDH